QGRAPSRACEFESRFPHQKEAVRKDGLFCFTAMREVSLAGKIAWDARDNQGEISPQSEKNLLRSIPDYFAALWPF
ncbi:MAG TPA: hypothetical protein PKL15_14950, partial [Saprospiraceae bacterium]|nr:hypothetical protein [Saprospiraceae bacterium]